MRINGERDYLQWEYLGLLCSGVSRYRGAIVCVEGESMQWGDGEGREGIEWIEWDRHGIE